MYGLGYLENFTVVHDGSGEADPFLVLYGCGETKQGVYVTGFALSKSRNVTPSLKTRLAQVQQASGFKPEAWCDIDNSCPLGGH